MEAVRFDQLSKRYKNGRGVHELSFSVTKGEVFGLLGPNGSGKTTTMKLMTGLIHPDSGQVSLLGFDPERDPVRAMAVVGCLIESPAYYPYLSAEQNLRLVSRLYPTLTAEDIAEVLQQVGLYAYRHERAAQYSLGMKQRLGLALALVSRPELLILDEPSNGLDIEGMADVRQLIKAQAAVGRTILLASHLAGEVEQVCTELAVLREGRLLGSSSVAEAVNRYGSVEAYYLALIRQKGEMAAS